MENCKGCCVVCSRTGYSCYWGKPRETTKTKQKACLWLTIVAGVTVLALIWMYICLVSYNDQEDVNWKGFTALKLWINWFMVLIILSGLLTTYCVFLLLFALTQVALKEPLNLHWAHKMLLLGGIVFIAIGVIGISLMWPEEWRTVQLSLEATAPFLQIGAVGALTLISKLVFQAMFTTNQNFSRYIIGTTFAVVSIVIFLWPLWIWSPCLIEKKQLPAKPELIGHRGAPMLAPENTIMSFNRSISCGVKVFETDVQLSGDREPFLMHDNNSNFLRRTTNAKETFPNKDLNASASLNLTEYESLNAGEWFIKTDPFRTVSQLSEGEKALARKQKIPSLLKLLDLAQQNNISVMFDLYSRQPQKDTNDTVTTILNSGIDHNLVHWLPPTGRKYVIARAPGFIQVYNNVKDMRSNKGRHLNLKYSKISAIEIRELREDNFEVNLWVVNERWLFSLLWCAGASSVTTNSCHTLKDMDAPDWTMSHQVYVAIWITVDVASLLIMVGLFVYHWFENQKMLTELERERTASLLNHK
ncbi:glycerophosphoinositol inositolphosphodiesterase GDPD2 [Eucyclogobius newberryi]|uniref:glycerophosphoinositol inositolphosphodiesterase GDPD2 n=1 Tax=Eucyclogobius newberryi TaxID=166745 RepID=UPI003B5ACE3B